MNLDHLAEALNCRVIETDNLDPGLNALYLHHHRAIVIRRDLDPYTRRSCLAHELAHCFHGDEEHDDPRLERRANQWASRLLISEDEYAAAEQIHGPHPQAIAWELGVTPDVVITWRELHERTHTQ